MLTRVKVLDAAVLYFFTPDSNLEAASVRHRIACVPRDIQQREFQLVCVRLDCQRTRLELLGNLYLGPERASQHISHVRDELGDIHGLQLKVRAPCEDKQPLGQCSTSIEVCSGASKPRLDIEVIGRAPGKKFEVFRNAQQQIIDIMRDATGELAQAFELMQLLYLGPR